MKLTATSVRTAELPEGKSEAIFFDDDISGFGLRLRAQGSRTFIFQYKLGRAQYRLNLGKVEALNFAEVRKTALQYYASVKRGENPADEKPRPCAKRPKLSSSTSTDISTRCGNAIGRGRLLKYSGTC